MYIYIYIYIERESEKQRERERERDIYISLLAGLPKRQLCRRVGIVRQGGPYNVI